MEAAKLSRTYPGAHEGITADECDVGAFEECGAEVCGVVYWCASAQRFAEIAADIEEHVKGSAGFREAESGDGLQTFGDVVATANEFLAHFGDAFLGAGECSECGVLGDAAGIGSLLALQLVDGGTDVVGSQVQPIRQPVMA
jgi:hypothetical protein